MYSIKKWINESWRVVMLKFKNVNFYFSKYPINNVDTDKIVISNKVFNGKKILKTLSATKIM